MRTPLRILLPLTVTALATFGATPARAAGGINLAWDDCGTFGAYQKNFACNTNSGASILYGSAVTGVAMPQLNGQASVIDMQTNQAALSPWWQMSFSGCRPSSSVVSDFNFISSSSCLDAWVGNAAGGISYTYPFQAPNRARIRTVCAIPGSTSITGTDEYYFFKVAITNARTVGNGSCAGCTDGMCLVLQSIQVTQPLGVGDYVLKTPLTRQHAVWQPGGSNVGGGPNGSGCPGATPTRTTTWGSVKSLYR